MTASIVAEAGVNHNGDLGLALELVDVAAAVGADVIKFQTFSADRLSTPWAPKTEYQSRSTPESQTHFEMLRELELSESDHVVLRDRASEVGIEFLSTPFDFQSLDFLVGRLGLTRIKIGSGDAGNLPLLVRLGRSGAQLILSTGMSTVEDVLEGLGAYVFGITAGPNDVPHAPSFVSLATSEEGRSVLTGRATVLQCTSEYPAADAHTNLAAMATLHAATGLPIGLSDHSMGTAIPIAAVALGACMVEKHITLDRSLPGPDHTSSLDPTAFAAMVSGIRSVEAAMGDGLKEPTAEALANRAAAGKSLFTARAIRAGQRFTEDDIVLLRPGSGAAPRDYWSWIGQPSPTDLVAGQALPSRDAPAP